MATKLSVVGAYQIDWNEFDTYTEKDGTNSQLAKDIPPDKIDQLVFNKDATQVRYDVFKNQFINSFTTHYSSMHPEDNWIGKSAHIIAQSALFWVAITDVNWGISVNLVKRPDANPGMQSQLASAMLRGIRKELIKYFGYACVQTGMSSVVELTDPDSDDGDPHMVVAPVIADYPARSRRRK